MVSQLHLFLDWRKRQAVVPSLPTDIIREKTKIEDILNEESAVAALGIETHCQPRSGWIVDIEAGRCECGQWLKFGYCVHLNAGMVHLDRAVVGLVRKRKFEDKRKKIVAKRPQGQDRARAVTGVRLIEGVRHDPRTGVLNILESMGG